MMCLCGHWQVALIESYVLSKTVTYHNSISETECFLLQNSFFVVSHPKQFILKNRYAYCSRLISNMQMNSYVLNMHQDVLHKCPFFHHDCIWRTKAPEVFDSSRTPEITPPCRGNLLFEYVCMCASNPFDMRMKLPQERRAKMVTY